jgi:hypothetical protein
VLLNVRSTLTNTLIHRFSMIAYDEARCLINSSNCYFCLCGVGQDSRFDWCCQKYGKLCRNVFEFVRLNIFKS